MDATTNIASTPPIDPPARPGWPLPVQIVFGVVATGVTLVTLLGNASVVLAFARTRRLHTYANIYIVSLAIADFLGEFPTLLLRLNWSLGYWPLGDTGCFVYNLVGTYAYHITYLITLVISLDRYFSVAYPIKHLSYRSTKVALSVISATCAVPVVLWTPFYSYWEFVYDGAFKRLPNLCYPLYFSNIYVTVGVIWVQTWLPLLLMITVYLKVYQIARNAVSRKTIRESASEAVPSTSRDVVMENVEIHIREMAARANPGFELDDRNDISALDSFGQKQESLNTPSLRTAPPNFESGSGENGPRSRKQIGSKVKRNQEKKALRTLTPIFISIMVSGLPWAIIAIVYVFCSTCIPSIINRTAVFLARTSSTMNPFCYAAVNPLYRQYFLKIVCAKNRRE
ncbi:muscarinic acetylcholine receptor M2-like [Patiria miniata]|uniref:G-protein coupled receptors family 1 profile domain-containing protein n=1 Tax=Patiria miniata TaxID=46514 RepID=A0A913YWN3_PATMI|nr:muscarinic acetylcholine receptor M2-like [Patiria miniata]